MAHQLILLPVVIISVVARAFLRVLALLLQILKKIMDMGGSGGVYL